MLLHGAFHWMWKSSHISSSIVALPLTAQIPCNLRPPLFHSEKVVSEWIDEKQRAGVNAALHDNADTSAVNTPVLRLDYSPAFSISAAINTSVWSCTESWGQTHRAHDKRTSPVLLPLLLLPLQLPRTHTHTHTVS